MKKLKALVEAIKTALKRRPEVVKVPTWDRSVCTNPGVAYVTVRCRQYAVVRRGKVVDRF
ncbi:MAG TPA: hypothetical protein EYP49_18465 [Anaerolineae bacterium]|nr:hypothetical protein [Anaerolineae bacterium]